MALTKGSIDAMPRRTNEFQQLVCLIENQLADTATVEESVLFTDILTKRDVEVDIVIRQTVNGIPICIGIECTSGGRRATVEWVRGMVGKHQTIPVDKTILVSRSGFTRQAIERAEAENILPLTLEQATSLEWLKFLKQLTNLKLGAVKLSPTGGTVRFAPDEGAPEDLKLTPSARIRVAENKFAGTFGQYIEALLRRSDVFESIIRKWLAQSAEQRKTDFEFTLDFNLHDHTEIETSADTWRVAESLIVKVRAEIADTPLNLTGGSFSGHEIAHGTAANIFTDKERPSQYVLVNMLGRGGIPVKASLMFPGTPKSEQEVFNMRFPADPDEET